MTFFEEMEMLREKSPGRKKSDFIQTFTTKTKEKQNKNKGKVSLSAAVKYRRTDRMVNGLQNLALFCEVKCCFVFKSEKKILLNVFFPGFLLQGVCRWPCLDSLYRPGQSKVCDEPTEPSTRIVGIPRNTYGIGSQREFICNVEERRLKHSHLFVI